LLLSRKKKTAIDKHCKNELCFHFRYIIDAAGQKLGRLATVAATYIRGKHEPSYSPSMDMGAMLIIINAEQVIMSGDKMNQKTYMRHVNGSPGSYTIEAFKDLQKRIPERIIEKAVYGMLPKGRLGRRIRLNMKVLPCPAS
jgi:large subunit ribosomal protein L13